MNRWVILLAASTLAASIAFAEEPAKADQELDVTMRVIADPDAKVPDEIVTRIPLPTARAPARSQTEKAAPGQDKATEARERGRELGQDTAARARERAEEHRHNDSANRGPPGGPPGRPPDPPARPKPPAKNPGG